MSPGFKRVLGDFVGTAIAIILGVSAGSTRADAADSKLTLAPPLVQVSVDPVVAPAGIPRRIVVAGVWPTGCIPTHAQVSASPSWVQEPALGILLAEPLTLQACTTALTPFRFELDHTPASAGQQEILVLTTLASPLAKGRLVTGEFAKGRARYDVAGAWYDPQVPGSGLMLAHDDGKTDAVFGTWQVYNALTGLPTWYSLQQGCWDTNGLVLEATLFETTSGTGGIHCAYCPLPAINLYERARVRLTFSVNGANGGLEAVFDLVHASGAAQRIASLRRFLPDRILFN